MSIQMLSAWGGSALASNGATIAVCFGTAALIVAVVALFRISNNNDDDAPRQTIFLSLSSVATIAGVAVFRLKPFPAPVFAQLGFVLVGIGWGFLIMFLMNAKLKLCSSRDGAYSRSLYAVAWLVLGLSTAIKCIDLDTWPLAINDYAAMHGVAGIDILENGVPQQWYQSGPNDLASGGISPLFFPVQVAVMKIFGPNLFANRFAEVIGSTVLLIVFLHWVMRFVGGIWGLLAFSLFALSPWHLAQSRLGTYQSISMAVGMTLLLCGTQILSERDSRPTWRLWGWWTGVALTTGLIGYCYAPLRLMYLFTALILILYILRHRSWHFQMLAPVLFVILTGLAFLSIQTSGPNGVGGMFTTSMGWATDTATWHKTLSHRAEDDVVTRELQPLGVIVSHWLVNGWRFVDHLSRLEVIDVLLAPFFCAGAFLVCAFLVRRREILFSAYYILGVLPAIIICPMPRRSCAMWPLISVAGVLFVKELVGGALRVGSKRIWGLGVSGVVSVGLLCSIVHGLHLFATTNSELGLGPPFAAPGRDEMIARALEIAPTCNVHLVNEYEQRFFTRLFLYEPLRNKGLSYQSIEVAEGRKIDPPDVSKKPACFIILNEARRNWIAPLLMESLPGGKLENSAIYPSAPFPEYQIYYYPSPFPAQTP